MADEVEFSFSYGDMVYSWDGGNYVYEWFEDGWEAILWWERQDIDTIPRAIEKVIDNNISPYRSWIVWPYEGERVIPVEFEAFKNYVINVIAKGEGKEAK